MCVCVCPPYTCEYYIIHTNVVFFFFTISLFFFTFHTPKRSVVVRISLYYFTVRGRSHAFITANIRQLYKYNKNNIKTPRLPRRSHIYHIKTGVRVHVVLGVGDHTANGWQH